MILKIIFYIIDHQNINYLPLLSLDRFLELLDLVCLKFILLFISLLVKNSFSRKPNKTIRKSSQSPKFIFNTYKTSVKIYL